MTDLLLAAFGSAGKLMEMTAIVIINSQYWVEKGVNWCVSVLFQLFWTL
jgi:hypothetical protein